MQIRQKLGQRKQAVAPHHIRQQKEDWEVGLAGWVQILRCRCSSKGDGGPWGSGLQSWVCPKEKVTFSQFSHSVMSNSLRPHGLQHTSLPCPSPTPRVYSNSCPSHQWCHPTISSSVVPFSSHLQSFPTSGSFQMSQFFESWPKYWSFSFSISPSKEYSGLISFRMDWLALLAVQGTLKSLLQHHSSKASILRHSAFFIVQLSHPYMTTGKP